MKKYFVLFCLVCCCAAILSSCHKANNHPTQPVQTGESDLQPTNAIYHWKTTFAPKYEELEFMKQHNIKRLYLRMFDVAPELNLVTGRRDIIPIATTQFEGFDRWRLEGVEVIPTTYITIEALCEMRGKEEEYAELIVERLRAMATHNKFGKIREMQLDCDWTTSTQQSYFKLCEASRDLLKADSIALSSTIRLHQLSQTAPPVDRGVLMLYNTGNLKSIDTQNSILDIKDVEPYLKKKIEYPIPLDYVYPTFGWGVKFYKWGDFKFIVSNPETETIEEGETMRIERPTVEEILAVKKLVENKLGKPSRGNIIYHLDKEQLKHYSEDEINKIFSDN